jgi:hypothetical protein
VNGNDSIMVQPTKEVIFKQSDSGLYYHDTSDRAIGMVNKVKENREGYTHRQYDDAKAAPCALGTWGIRTPKTSKRWNV